MVDNKDILDQQKRKWLIINTLKGGNLIKPIKLNFLICMVFLFRGIICT